MNLETIHSDLDDIVTRGLPSALALNIDRGKSLRPGWQTKVAPGTIVPDTVYTPATALPHRCELGDDRAKMLPSTNSELDDDDEATQVEVGSLFRCDAAFLVATVISRQGVICVPRDTFNQPPNAKSDGLLISNPTKARSVAETVETAPGLSFVDKPASFGSAL